MGKSFTLLLLLGIGFALLLLRPEAGRIAAQANLTDVQQTLDASVGGLFTQTARAQSQMVMTGTVQALFEQALTATAAAPVQTPLPASELRHVTDASIISEIDLLAGPAYTSAYFAPNGEYFAYLTREEICIYSSAGEQARCTPTEDRIRSADPELISWSPDSRYLVLNEDFLRTFHDPDIWVIDVTNGELIDLTDDQQDRVDIGAQDWDDIDIAPRWLADGRIAFLRYARQEGVVLPPDLMVIDLDSSSLEKLGTLETGPTFATYGFDVSPDGTLIAYNRYDQETESLSGVWISSIDGSDARQLVKTEPNLTPFAVEFSADGRYLLTIAALQGTLGAVKPEDSTVRVISVDSGESQLADDERMVIGAGWSPDGSTLAYLVHNIIDPGVEGLYVSDLPGERGHLILQGDYAPHTSIWRQPIVWATNNMMLLTKTPEPGIVIVQLVTG